MIVDYTGNVSLVERSAVCDKSSETWIDAGDFVDVTWKEAHSAWVEWVRAKYGKKYIDPDRQYPDPSKASIVIEDALCNNRMRKILKICTRREINSQVVDIINEYENCGMTVMHAAGRIAALDRESYEKRGRL